MKSNWVRTGGYAVKKARLATPEGRFKHMRTESEHPWSLTYEEFLELWQKPCWYCGDAIQTIGIDRIDSSKGYETGNVLPCCAPCNYAKRNRTQEDFIKRCHRIAQLHPL